MDKKPQIINLDCSKGWEHSFDKFNVKVIVPKTDLPEDIINFGYEAPYLIVLSEKELTLEEAEREAKANGLFEVAEKKATSVVFVYPNSENGWDDAKDGLYEELIAESKIHQYHEDGVAVLKNRFTNTTDGYAIRGAIFRVFLFAQKKAADYVAKNLLRKIEGQGLWGTADIVPTGCVLADLSVVPDIQRRDMPIVSVNNSDAVNDEIKKATDYYYEANGMNYSEIYENFLKKHMRWGWVGTLEETVDFESLNMVEEFAQTDVKTTEDDFGDYKGTETHPVGYIAYYNKDLFEKGPAPLLLCFHGGGDSAMHISQVSGWYRVAHDHDFLLICIEDHLNSTATEMMELLKHLKDKYEIDERRIYASGFSMGGCKSWDLFQEYPTCFAALAPMDATFEVGLNVFGKPAPVKINESVPVPVFYVGGEETPLPELPFQAQKCYDRMKYVLDVNEAVTEYNVHFEDHENWPDRIWGISGDRVEKIYDPDRDSYLTINYFESRDGITRTAFASVSGQGHECRYHSCEHAWRFMEKFTRKV